MSNPYEQNRRRREASRERALMGETLAQFHERERPRVQLGDRLPRARCKSTGNLFDQQPQLFDKITRDEQ